MNSAFVSERVRERPMSIGTPPLKGFKEFVLKGLGPERPIVK